MGCSRYVISNLLIQWFTMSVTSGIAKNWVSDLTTSLPVSMSNTSYHVQFGNVSVYNGDNGTALAVTSTTASTITFKCYNTGSYPIPWIILGS